MYRYSQILIIGMDRVAENCLRSVLRVFPASAVKTVGYNVSHISSFCMTAERTGVAFSTFDRSNKAELKAMLMELSEPTLIVSANNVYLFPREVCEKTNLSIINYHPSLLPAYPGLLTLTWALFSGEKTVGVTWHYVSPGIDDGDIICQKRCPVGPDTIALDLLRQCMELGREAFDEILEPVLEDRANRTKQVPLPGRRIYLARDIPDNAIVRPENDAEYSYRMLRSIDYKGLPIVPNPVCRLTGKDYSIRKYSFSSEERGERALPEVRDGTIVIQDGTGTLRLHVRE